MNSSSYPTGLFGFSYGLTIRNVVLDSSCSITSSRRGSYVVFIGGIIGECYASSRQCNIENTVNMADVTFSGNISGALLIGGIVGFLYSSSSYVSCVKNCVNYGFVTDSGTINSYSWAEIGGVVGYSHGILSCLYIQNCLNYGKIRHNGTSSDLDIGGIVGNCPSYTYIENCVSAGKISTQTTASSSNHIGGIVGYAYANTRINYCYYASDVGISRIYGAGTPSKTGTPESPTAGTLTL